MIYYQLTICYLLSFSLLSCAQNERYIDDFKDTKSYELALAVEREDLRTIEKLVKTDSTLMDFANPVFGSNVLMLSVNIEKYKSFEKLLELGANPNFINPDTKYSVLIDAIQPFGSQFEWRKDNRYIKLLLAYGADPNYAVENDFANENGNYIFSKSPLLEASNLDLDAVKILIENGADPHKRIGTRQVTGFSKAVERGKIDIINYYIDSLGVDVHQPMSVVVQEPSNKEVTYFIQDYIVNKFIKAKLFGDSEQLENLKRSNEGIEESNQDLWMLIKKLEEMGVDFKNYDYKK